MALPKNLTLGTSIGGILGAGKTWGLVSGYQNLGQAIARRLSTPPLFYDTSYGFDLRTLLNSAVNTAQYDAAISQVEQQCLADERVRGVSIVSDYNQLERKITLRIALSTNEGPFTLVLAVTALTVELLTVAS